VIELACARVFGNRQEDIMAKKEHESVVGIWALYAAEQKKVEEEKEKLQKLQADADILKQKLMSMIPDNQVVEGVIHKHFERRSVSYSSVVSYLREKLIPASKQKLVDTVIEENTSVVATDKIELAK
jgi:hypothetical protein